MKKRDKRDGEREKEKRERKIGGNREQKEMRLNSIIVIVEIKGSGHGHVSLPRGIQSVKVSEQKREDDFALNDSVIITLLFIYYYSLHSRMNE